MSFELSGVWYRYPFSADYSLRDVSLAFEPGRHTAVLGPNGAGKTTLIRILLGRLRGERGEARFAGRPSADWRRRELARLVGVVAQEPEPAVPLTVRQLVEMGRHPYLRPWVDLRRADHAAVARALHRTDLVGLEERPVARLSGGELQRARLARALAQEPEVLLLDEPTAHLDIAHEMGLFLLIAELVAEEDLTVISVTHNINLASRFAQRLVLLAEGRIAASGSPAEVLTPGHVAEAFRWPVRVTDSGPLGRQVIPLERAPRSGEIP